MKKIFSVLLLNTLLFLHCNSGFAEIALLKRVPFNAEGFRDPFKSLLPEKKIDANLAVAKTSAPEMIVLAPDIEIQGIVWGGKFPQAIINGKVLKEGDVLAGETPVTILEIKPKEVAVLYKTKIFTFSR